MRKSSQAVRRLSNAFSHLTHSKSHDSAEGEGSDPTTARRKSSTRQPCGHITDAKTEPGELKTEYGELGRRSSCVPDPRPSSRRKGGSRVVAGPSERKRKSGKSRPSKAVTATAAAGRSEEIDWQSRRKNSSNRHTLYGYSQMATASGGSTGEPFDKEALKRVGKLPEVRTFRQPIPFPVTSAIRSQ